MIGNLEKLQSSKTPHSKLLRISFLTELRLPYRNSGRLPEGFQFYTEIMLNMSKPSSFGTGQAYRFEITKSPTTQYYIIKINSHVLVYRSVRRMFPDLQKLLGPHEVHPDDLARPAHQRGRCLRQVPVPGVRFFRQHPGLPLGHSRPTVDHIDHLRRVPEGEPSQSGGHGARSVRLRL